MEKLIENNSVLVDEFIVHTLQKLIDYDSKNNSSLLETLEAYLNSGMNKSLTASELYVHKNTVKYRLNKIEEILKKRISEPDVAFTYRLALHLRRVKKV